MVGNDSTTCLLFKCVHGFAVRGRGKVRENKQEHMCILKSPRLMIALARLTLRHVSNRDLLIVRGNEYLEQ